MNSDRLIFPSSAVRPVSERTQSKDRADDVNGMVEKVIIADHLAIFVDANLAQYQTLSTGGAWLAILGYTFQIYFDFCGYSDMAVGLGTCSA